MISILTATYNREKCLNLLYKSLLIQNNKNFEWIIIDDGSIDRTKDVVNNFISENKINIKYFHQKNKGKHCALNKGIEECKGELIIFVDSDDYLTNNAVEILEINFNNIKDNPNIAGVGGIKIFKNGNMIGENIPVQNIDATTFEYRYKLKVTGDKAEAFKKEILKKYKFPQFKFEKFIPEALVYNRIANDGYKLRWINDPICICEYRSDGLSAQAGKLFSNSWNGYSLYLKEMLIYKEVPIILKMKLIINYIIMSLKYKKNPKKVFK